MKFDIAIPSYGRAGLVKSHLLFPSAVIVVCEAQAAAYREHYGTRVVTVPDSEDGGISRKRNAILNRFENVLIVDDDLSAVEMFELGARIKLAGDYLFKIVARYFDLAAALGVTFWGVNSNTDANGHDTFQPFNLLALISGPWGGHLKPALRYDERLNGKEDVDFWLRTVARHRLTLRVNKIHYLNDHAKLAGGFAAMRTMDKEKADMEFLRRRFGSKVVSFGGSIGAGHLGTDILNTVARVPIRGC